MVRFMSCHMLISVIISLLSVHQVLGLSSDKHFVFISASYNNAEWCERSLASVFSQDYTDWSIIYIDDCSTDGTGELVDRYVAECGMSDKVRIIHNEQRMLHCYNQYHAIHACPDNVIIAILDGDDWLAHDGVLTLLNEVYQEDVWITYGQFWYHKRGALGCSRQIPHEVIKNNSIRKHPSWITSHMRTFYAGLYKKIKLEDLMYEGAFLPMSVDAAVMLPMIEMAGWHSRFIKEIIYIYNDANTQSFFHEKAEMQRQILTMLRSYPPYEPLLIPPYLSAPAIENYCSESLGSCSFYKEGVSTVA